MSHLTRPARVFFCSILLAAITTTPVFAKRRAVQLRTGLPEVQRVVVVILENADFAQALDQPYLSYLTRHGGLLTNYHAIGHPSQPNYVALTAGDPYGVTSDDPFTADATHIGDLMDAHNLSWRIYAENYPGNCFSGNQVGDPKTGQYLRKHNPFISYSNVSANASRCDSAIVDANSFDADVYTNKLPHLSYYIPNSYNDGHQTSLTFADAWLRSRFDPLLSDPRFIAGTLFIVVFDEATSTGSNTVYCSFYGAGVKPGASSAELTDHYSLLRTIEDIFHVGTLHHHDDTAVPISGIWR